MVGVLTDDTDPMVSVMKLEKAPNETYADIGGLDQQIQEIKVSMLLASERDTIRGNSIENRGYLCMFGRTQGIFEL